MVTLFGRRAPRTDAPRSKPRRSAPVVVNRVDLAELTPALLPYLGHAAYLQLVTFQTLSRAIATAPSIEGKETLSRVAAMSLAKHHGLVDEIARTGAVPATVMAPYIASIDSYAASTFSADWHETLVAGYVTAGLLDDFSRQLAGGLPEEAADRIIALLSKDNGHTLIVSRLRESLEANPPLASRLAMWGRRLVGDTLLVARSALAADSQPDEARLEPVFTELIAAHTRRMDALGLTA